MQQSDKEAERWWVRAGEGREQRGEGESEQEEGEEDSVVRAQNTLGMFYSQQETLNMKKVLITKQLLCKFVCFELQAMYYDSYIIL